MRQGYSWSGREANAFYLNTGGHGFADGSRIVGFGLPDDSRGLALADWDGDGDLDIWQTNRNAPMLRFFENTAKRSNVGCTIQLIGAESNRDGIGARATLTLRSGRKLVRSVHAGSGYLSQSSKRLHFGWLPADSPTTLSVDWPSGKRTTHPFEHTSTRFSVEEGDTELTGIGQVSEIAYEELESVRPKPPRLFSFSKPWLPKPLITTSPRERPLLVQVWAPWCAACLAERKEFSEARDAMTSAGIDVMAVSVDADADSKSSYPYVEVTSSPEFLDTLEAFQRALLDHQEPLRLPLSFLLDREGRLTGYYSGRVTPEEVIADSRPTSDLLKAALPFEGDWLHPPVPKDPLDIALQFVASGKRANALAYLDQLVVILKAKHPDSAHWNVANFHAFRGSLLENDLKPPAYLAALESDPTHFESLKQLGQYFLAMRNVKKATPLIVQALAQQPQDAELLFAQAQLQFATNEVSSAIDTLRQLVAVDSTHWTATNNLAWLLATHPNAKLRNGQEALKLASTLPLDKEANYADTLAAAYAESGYFKEAQKVIAAAQVNADEVFGNKLELRAQAYAEGRPWRSSFGSSE